MCFVVFNRGSRIVLPLSQYPSCFIDRSIVFPLTFGLFAPSLMPHAFRNLTSPTQRFITAKNGVTNESWSTAVVTGIAPKTPTTTFRVSGVVSNANAENDNRSRGFRGRELKGRIGSVELGKTEARRGIRCALVIWGRKGKPFRGRQVFRSSASNLCEVTQGLLST